MFRIKHKITTRTFNFIVWIYVHTWSVRKVLRILNLSGLRIFDFRVFCVVMLILICLPHLCRQAQPLNVQLFWLDVFWLVFDFCPFSFGSKKRSQGDRSGECCGCGNIIVLPKIHAQATMYEQGGYHGPKVNFCSSTNPGVLDCFAQIGHNLQVIFLIDNSTMIIW